MAQRVQQDYQHPSDKNTPDSNADSPKEALN